MFMLNFIIFVTSIITINSK